MLGESDDRYDSELADHDLGQGDGDLGDGDSVDGPSELTATVEDGPASAEVPYTPVDATPEVPTPPTTGDETIDDAMLRLAQSQAGPFAERIDAGEHAHRSLQSRLGGLGGA